MQPSAVVSSKTHIPYQLKESPYSSHSLVLEHFPAPGNGRKVLDIGCGSGYLGAILADRGYVVTGIERAGWHSGFPDTVNLIEADLEHEFPALPDQYDMVICADILEHLRRPEELLRHVRNVMRPSGLLIASLPNSGHLYFRLNVLFGRFPQHDKGLFDRTHIRFYMWDGWLKLLEDAEFAVRSTHSTGVPVGLAVPKFKDSLLVRAAEGLSFLMARVWKKLFAYQFIVTAALRQE